jgi:hypothetical protein
MKTTQRNWIISRLTKRGKISRNECLSRFISRLAMHIDKLHKDGWETEGHNHKTKNGIDYVYTLIKKP